MLDNKRCDWREILEAHSQCTTQRMTALPVVLCLTDLTDTTGLDFKVAGVKSCHLPACFRCDASRAVSAASQWQLARPDPSPALSADEYVASVSEGVRSILKSIRPTI